MREGEYLSGRAVCLVRVRVRVRFRMRVWGRVRGGRKARN